MPQRILKPGIVTSVRYNRLTWPAQSLHDRLVTLVDDFARYDAEPLVLARVVFPFGDSTGRPITVEEAEGWLQELVQQDMVMVYTAGEKRCLQLKRWTERCRAVNSRFPAPPQLELPLSSTCPPSPANASTCPPSPANAALPSSTATATRPVPDQREKKNGAGVAASRTQWASLSRRIKELENRGEHLETDERKELRKKRAALHELEEQQQAGKF